MKKDILEELDTGTEEFPDALTKIEDERRAFLLFILLKK
jgi:hypothetical protein